MNRISNATGLDGTTGYTGATGVDEETIGAPGRIVVLGASGMTSPGVAVVTGQWVDAFVLFGTASGTPAAQCVIGATVVDLVVKRGDGRHRRGIPSTFSFGRARFKAPATGSAKIRVTGTGSAYMLKPFIDTGVWLPDRQTWQAGPHANPDLDLPAWPAELRGMSEAVNFAPIALRKEFAGDAGVPITRRTGTTPRGQFQGGMTLNVDERDRLDVFYRSGAEPFWFNRPDTAELCRAYWLADGEPADAGHRTNNARTTAVGLLLEVA